MMLHPCTFKNIWEGASLGKFKTEKPYILVNIRPMKPYWFLETFEFLLCFFFLYVLIRDWRR